jgi:hypothetical protein
MNMTRNQYHERSNNITNHLRRFQNYLTVLTKRNEVHDEIKRIINSVKDCYYSDGKLLSSCLLYKTLKDPDEDK